MGTCLFPKRRIDVFCALAADRAIASRRWTNAKKKEENFPFGQSLLTHCHVELLDDPSNVGVSRIPGVLPTLTLGDVPLLHGIQD